MRLERTRIPAWRALIALWGLALSCQCLAQNNPVPFVNQPLVPTAAAPGGAAFTLTVNGTGFVSGSVVQWNGSPRTTTFVSGSQLKAAILATDLNTTGTASVTVVSPAPGGGMSNVVFFQVTLPSSSTGFSRADIAAGNGPGGIAAADLNGDGKLDLAVVNTTDNTVSIYLGNGDGTFQPRVDYATAAQPIFVVSADFNGDGRLDLAVLSGRPYQVPPGPQVSILLGNGDGTFQTHKDYALPDSYGHSLFVADFNGDGKLDLGVVGGEGGGFVDILLGNGDGSLQSAIRYPAGAAPESVAVGDFNRDGNLDLAVGDAMNFGSYIYLFLGNGDGTFTATTSPLSAGVTPVSVATADFSGDGKLDLAALGGLLPNYVTGGVCIFLGNADGSFQSHVDYSTGGTVQGEPDFLKTGDFNGDGAVDLSFINSSLSAVSILLGKFDGTFQNRFDFGVGTNASSMAVGDFNGDGRLDLAVTNSADNTVSILLQVPAPGVTLSSASADLGNETIGATSSPQTITLKNTGSAALTLTSITITGADSNDFALASSSTCPTGGGTLQVGASCNIVATFKPTDWGTRSATLSVTDNAPDSPQTVSLSGMGQDFSLSLSNSTTGGTITPGGTEGYTVAISPEGGFNQTVTLACSGAPPHSTCSVSPSSVTLDGTNSGNVTVTVATTAPTVSPGSLRRLSPGIGFLLWPLVLLMLALLERRKERRVRLVLAASLLLLILWASCGGGGVVHTPGTPKGTYTLTVTGTMTSSFSSAPLTHTLSLTLNVI